MDEKERIERAVAAALDADVQVARLSGGRLSLTVSGMSRRSRFRAAWVRRGWPADVRSVIERSPEVTLVAAPALSVGARRLLDERGVNWVDETGAASVRAPGLMVRIDRAPAPADPAPRQASWSRAAIAAGEAVLALRPDRLTTAWLAEHAGCSVPRAGQILTSWDVEGWTVKRGPARGAGAHRTLETPDAMLDSWAAYLNARPIERWFAHTTEQDLEAVAQRIAGSLDGLRFAWTGWAAAERLAPFVSQLPVLQLRVDERYGRRDIEARLREAGVTLTQDAGHVELWPTTTHALDMATPSPDGPVASWPRIYADLERLGGRGHDAAAHLRDVMESGRGL